MDESYGQYKDWFKVQLGTFGTVNDTPVFGQFLGVSLLTSKAAVLGLGYIQSHIILGMGRQKTRVIEAVNFLKINVNQKLIIRNPNTFNT